MVQYKTVNRGTNNKRTKQGDFLMTQQSGVPLCFVGLRILPLSTSRDNRSFKMGILNNKKCAEVEGKEEQKREVEE